MGTCSRSTHAATGRKLTGNGPWPLNGISPHYGTVSPHTYPREGNEGVVAPEGLGHLPQQIIRELHQLQGLRH